MHPRGAYLYTNNLQKYGITMSTPETNTILQIHYTTIKKKKNVHTALFKMNNQQGPTV